MNLLRTIMAGDPCSMLIGFVVFVIFYTIHGVVRIFYFVKDGVFIFDYEFVLSLIAFFFAILGCTICVCCQCKAMYDWLNWNCQCSDWLKSWRRRRRRRRGNKTLRDYELEERGGSAGRKVDEREVAEQCDTACTGSSSHLRKMLPTSSSRPLPA